MGYSYIYGIKGNLSNSTLYRCKGKLLVDAGYAALSKAVLYIIISRRGSLSPDKVSLPAGKQPNLLFFKGLRKPQYVKRNWAPQPLGPKCRPKTQ